MKLWLVESFAGLLLLQHRWISRKWNAKSKRVGSQKSSSLRVNETSCEPVLLFTTKDDNDDDDDVEGFEPATSSLERLIF